MKKQSKGITLVALIVTIIILLILAGISIAQLTGNGLFEKARLAKEKSEKAQELEDSILKDYEEKIQGMRNATLEESKIINNFTIVAQNISTNKITINLSENTSTENVIGYIVFIGNDAIDVTSTMPYDISNLQIDTEYKEIYIIAIDNKGNIKISDNKLNVKTKDILVIINQIEENPTEYYGKKVINYGDGNWRLFNCDLEGKFGIERSVFLIHSNVGNSKLNGLSQNTINDDSTNSTQLKSIKWLNEHLNKEWCKIGLSDNNYKINVLKELLSTSGAWYNNTLIDNKHQIEYIIGAPTIELYVDSYNKTHETDIAFSVPNSGGYSTINTTLTELNGRGIYLFDDNGETYIASPNSYNSNSITTCMNKRLCELGSASSSKPGKFPIVCLSEFVPVFEED